ncbi:FAD-dependent oxidoreductase [Mesorhizobium sp.]|uniref:FAD-dependent oxidoreductase n=1 Tax=Mesorhizobium sp. TaxID=1871066 RepID=UPI000FE9E89A|nr:FAD-dependent oxidoreductase [Mesorhizobium sp.]RWD42124.1 MAG: FAD-dependent oxidoreductase [Mesorhizobium sp.]
MCDIIVLGAGVAGLTSAYTLAREGFTVTVIDAGAGPAEDGASFGNGAQLSYSYTDALASPSLVANLPKLLLGQDPAFRLTPNLSPRFWAWSLSFLANATQTAFERNTVAVLNLAMESREQFGDISQKVDFDYRKVGKLVLYSTHEAVRKAEVLSHLKNRYGAQLRVLTTEEVIDREPALADYGHTFAGALWSPLDEAGDSLLFCRNLRTLLEDDYGVRFQFGTTVKALRSQAGKIVAIATDDGEICCDRAVIALGAWSAAIARTVGIRLPIWAMQGYSITVPAMRGAPSVSVTDTARKVVFCRIGDRLRIAGLADIGGARPVFQQKRFNTLLQAAKEAFPNAGDFSGDVNAWTSVRPMTPNSQPIVGSSAITGVYLNCGHGSLGWTLSMATATRLAKCVVEHERIRHDPCRPELKATER